ncbi:30S ribosomal protein S9 [Candidatus Microthrix parvicella]
MPGPGWSPPRCPEAATVGHRSRPGALSPPQEHIMGHPLVQATGRRKRAVARVRVRHGSGQITVNNRPVEAYFPNETHRMVLAEPLRLTEMGENYDIDATIHGGGPTGQAGAMRLGIARGLVALDAELRDSLKQAGFLTRDDRKKESKKYGLKKARKAPQYSKR